MMRVMLKLIGLTM